MRGKARTDLVLIGQQADEPGRALKYEPHYCDDVRIWAQEGKFPETWCARIGIHRATFYRWANDNPEFEEAILQAWVILQHYWTEYAVRELKNKDLKSAVLLTILKARFPRLYGRPEILEGTLEHFQARNAPEPAPLPAAGQTDHGITSREALQARVAELQDRMKQRETK